MSLLFGGGQIHTGGGNTLNLPDVANPTGGSANVVVQHNVVLHPTADRLGINVNYWEDGQQRRNLGAQKFRTVLSQIRGKFIRYPGGHKADGVTFFLDADGDEIAEPTPRLCRFGSGEWPATSTDFWSTNSQAGTWTRNVYQLQDFLEDCQAFGAEPVIVVALDTVNNPPTGTGAWTPTLAQIATNAAAMVRWCNITHGYNVKYWEIGNESWSDGWGYAHGYDTGAEYGADFAVVAAAMKAIDPTIYVGLNGSSQVWFEDAIAAAGAANVDFLAAHRYPFFGNTYAQYLENIELNMVSEANRAQNAINTLSAPHNTRIFVMMTEAGYNSQPNNMGAALILAHILGGNLASSSIVGTMIWNTRYAPLGTSHDMFDQDNRLTPVGLGAWMASLLAPGAMVQTAVTTVTNVFAYASYSRKQDRTAVLLINRNASEQVVTVACAGSTLGRLRVLSGSGPSDTAPSVAESTPTPSAGVFTLTLPATSVSVLTAGRVLAP